MTPTALAGKPKLVHCLALGRLGGCLGEIRNVVRGSPSIPSLVPLHSLLIGIPLARQDIVARDTANRDQHLVL